MQNKNKLIINITYKNKTKVKNVKKILKTLIQKQLEQKIIDQLQNQNVLFVELKKQDL